MFGISYAYSSILRTFVVSVRMNCDDESAYSVCPPEMCFQFSRVVIFSGPLMKSRLLMLLQKGPHEACDSNKSSTELTAIAGSTHALARTTVIP